MIGKDGEIGDDEDPCMLIGYSHDQNNNFHCMNNPKTKKVKEITYTVWLKQMFTRNNITLKCGVNQEYM